MTKMHVLGCDWTRTVRGVHVAAVALSLWLPAGHAQQPTPAQQSAIRQSCRSDFQANCSGVPTGGAEALQCLKQNFDKVSLACQKALSPVMGGAAAPAAAGTPDSSAGKSTSSPPKVPPGAAGGQGALTGGGQPASMREEMMLTREMCGPEFRSYCGNVQLGGGRAMQCLEANSQYLSPRCKAALAEIRARR